MRPVTAREAVPGRDAKGTYGFDRIELSYDPGDPYVVKLTFLDQDVCWEFARSVLAEGVEGHAGLGDVRAWPSLGYVHLRLANDGEMVTLELRRRWVESFLGDSYRLVPLGRERVDVDSVIGQILGSDA